jgi:hypothetical protein
MNLAPPTYDVAPSVAHLVSSKVPAINMSFRPFTPVRKGAAIPRFWVETVVHVTVELSMAVKPRASADEEAAAVKPFWAVVTVWSTVIRISIEVAIRTYRGRPDTDANLGVRCWTDRYQTDYRNSGQ